MASQLTNILLGLSNVALGVTGIVVGMNLLSSTIEEIIEDNKRIIFMYEVKQEKLTSPTDVVEDPLNLRPASELDHAISSDVKPAPCCVKKEEGKSLLEELLEKVQLKEPTLLTCSEN